MSAKILVIDYDEDTKTRIAAAKEVLSYIINIHESVFCIYEWDDDHVLPLRGMHEYGWELFDFPKGTSQKMASYRMRRRGYEPANPLHMLVFAAQAFNDNRSFGEWHRYVIGLGGELQTVLGAQFGGLNQGTCFFFQHLPQNKWKHDGGRNNRFLGVREIRKKDT